MGTAESKEMSGKPVVVVIGGGYAGVNVAKELDTTGHFNVVLIDRKNYFLHNVAGLRAAVYKEWGEKICLPYSQLLLHGTVVHGEVIEVGQQGVLVYGREEPIRFDYLIIATGSSYAFPGKIASPTREEALKKYAELADVLEGLENVVIAGGGPVGVELAGEILEKYPEKNVTIVHSHKHLVNQGLSDNFMEKAQKQLTELGAKLILGERVDMFDHDLKDEIKHRDEYFLTGDRVIKTNKGTEIEADIVFICTGIVTNNKSLLHNFSELLDVEGRLKVNEHFQVEGYENIFALGDCCNMEAKMAYFAGKQAPAVAKNIEILEHNKKTSKHKELKVYHGSPYPVMLLSIGQHGGVTQFANKSGTVLGRKATTMMKSKTLFTKKYWAITNQKLDWDDPHPTLKLKGSKGIKKKNLAAALGISEKEASKLIGKGLPAVEKEEGEEKT